MIVVIVVLVFVVLILLINYLYKRYVESRMYAIAVDMNNRRKANKINKKIEKELR